MTTTKAVYWAPVGKKADERRIPPGQYVADDFPVLNAGPMSGRAKTERFGATGGE